MKKMMKFALIMLFPLGLTSCDLFNVDVESTLTGTLDIAVAEDMNKGALEAYPFNASTTMSMDDPDVIKYKDNIVSVGVDGIVAEVVSVTKNGAPIDGVAFLSGSIFTMSNGVVDASYSLSEDWDIAVGSTVSLDDLGGFYDDVSTILSDVEDFNLGMTGTSSEQGVLVTISIDIDVTITGNPF
ncbi:MAG: hypothetical protein V2B15_09900 [Bacteroidota bacterium]